MGEREVLDALRDAIVDLNIEGVQKAARKALESNIPPIKAISEGMAKGMDVVGEKFEEEEYFLSELIMAGEVMREGMKILKPYLEPERAKATGKVVLGTVRGDLHDIGKNIVAMLLEAAGFEVIDLGVDVPARKFVESVQQIEPQILGMSALLIVTMPEMETAVNDLKKSNLRDGLKIIIGGAPITPEYAQKIDADYAAKDAVDGVKKCKAWATRFTNPIHDRSKG